MARGGLVVSAPRCDICGGLPFGLWSGRCGLCDQAFELGRLSVIRAEVELAQDFVAWEASRKRADAMLSMRSALCTMREHRKARTRREVKRWLFNHAYQLGSWTRRARAQRSAERAVVDVARWLEETK